MFTDLTRRTCDKLEKDFLREKGVVTETQSDLGKLFSFKCNDIILFDILLILLLSHCATQKLVAFTKYIQFEI